MLYEKQESTATFLISKCNFSESISKYRGGSIYISILNEKESKSIEINGCSFNEINSPFGGSIDIQCSNPFVLFYIVILMESLLSFLMEFLELLINVILMILKKLLQFITNFIHPV